MGDSVNYDLELLTELNTKLSKNDSMFRLLLKKSGLACGYYNFTDKRTECFGNWKELFGFNGNEFVTSKQITSLVDAEHVNSLFECLTIDRRNKDFYSVEFHISSSDIWVECRTYVIYDCNKKPLEKIIYFSDITKHKLANDELSYMAYYDSMTGLYNRNYFANELKDMIEKAADDNSIVSVLFFDIDDFRRINDSLGILAGDEIVQKFGNELRKLTNENIKASHFNGDIFCMAINNANDGNLVEETVERIRKIVANPFILSNGAEVLITVSIGIAGYPEASNDAMELISLAEIVMFRAKHLGRNITQYFDEPIIKEYIHDIELEQRMEKAINSGEFFMYYQPQFDSNNKTLRGVEALVRWKDENGNIISPGKFIPIAEKNGIILKLGDFIINKSLSDYANWINKYGDIGLILSINISAVQFKSKNFVNDFIRSINKYKISPSNIELEITESVFIDDMNDMIEKMNILREMGIRFSMDDFGTGFSSLSYLRQLPIDTLKIDKSFVDTVVTDGPTRTIAESIIDLSRKLGFDTIAEGVEEEVQYSLLKNIGCENIQGFYFGKPMDVADIETLYKESSQC